MERPEKVRVVLADDHAAVRAGIRSLLEKAEDITVVGEACNGEEALVLASEFMPDILLLDMEMPKLNGRQVAQKISERGLPVQIVVLSAYDDIEYISNMLDIGVAGYLTKDEVPGLLFNAIRGVARGEVGWVSKRVSEKIKTYAPVDSTNRMTLTAQESEVLNLLSKKKSPKEIAKLLNLAEDTIQKDIELLTKKFKAKSLIDLIVFARNAKMI
jgi:DNA-binding NarL/FixJ family response regulator